MAHFNRSSISVPDVYYKPALCQKMCGAYIQARITALERNLSGDVRPPSACTPKPEIKRRTTIRQTVKSSSGLLKPAESQSDTDFSESSVPSHRKIGVIKSSVKESSDDYRQNSVSFASTKPGCMNYNKVASFAYPKPKAQKSDVPLFPNVRPGIKPSLSQKSISTKDRDDGVKTNIGSSALKLPNVQKSNSVRVSGTENKLQRQSKDLSVPKKRLPDVLYLGDPPPKPNRPPCVDIHRFRRNLMYCNNGLGMKMPPPVPPPSTRPRLRLCPSSDHAAALSQQLEKEINDDVDTMSFPSLLLEAGEDDVYVNVDDPDTSASPLSQMTNTYEDVYDDVDFDYSEKDCIYEND